MTPIEQKAKELFEWHAQLVSGHIWDWDIASEEVKRRYIARATGECTKPFYNSYGEPIKDKP